jgi:hypothetical protein
MWRNTLHHLEQYLSQDSASRTFDYYRRQGNLFATSSATPSSSWKMSEGGEEEQEEEGDPVQRNKVKLLLHEAISLTSSLSAMISIHEKRAHEVRKRHQKRQKEMEKEKKRNSEESQVVSCGFCKREGIFFDKKLKVPRSLAPSLALVLSSLLAGTTGINQIPLASQDDEMLQVQGSLLLLQGTPATALEHSQGPLSLSWHDITLDLLDSADRFRSPVESFPPLQLLPPQRQQRL